MGPNGYPLDELPGPREPRSHLAIISSHYDRGVFLLPSQKCHVMLALRTCLVSHKPGQAGGCGQPPRSPNSIFIFPKQGMMPLSSLLWGPHALAGSTPRRQHAEMRVSDGTVLPLSCLLTVQDGACHLGWVPRPGQGLSFQPQKRAQHKTASGWALGGGQRGTGFSGGRDPVSPCVEWGRYQPRRG